jgi:hypothetical protein
MSKVGIVTLKGDIHAQAVCHLATLQGRSIFHFETDFLRERPSTFRIGTADIHTPKLTDSSGTEHCLADFAAIWWRRPSGRQLTVHDDVSPDVDSVIENSARSHVYGLFNAVPHNIVVNNPIWAQHAENKIVQLKCARQIGFNIPNTLFSNDYSAVKRFFFENNGDVVVKSYFNSPELQLKTTLLTPNILSDRNSFAVSPAIYQTLIKGTHHIRAVAVRGNYQAVLFINSEVDSRLNLSGITSNYTFDPKIHSLIENFLIQMNLDMGIFDFKIDESGVLYFLEINQQGQFAYLDMITETKCLQMVTDYLLCKGLK